MSARGDTSSPQWWREAVVYQVYWRSFQDSDGDGVGDLRGVIRRLDYISELGVDMIWLNPFYASPDIDHGYDISDYYTLMDKAGSWDDLSALIKACHERGLKVMLDLVLNHTSDQHQWFQDALDPNHPHHDYYIWRRGVDGGPPTNWRSWCEPSCWTYRPEVDAYYLHSFTREQPDLNWANPRVRQELYQVVRFWAQQGIAGFRLDVINLIGKPETFQSVEAPQHHSYLANQPAVHDHLRELCDEVFQDSNLCTVGETPFVTPREVIAYAGFEQNMLNMLIHFEHMDRLADWSLTEYRALQKEWCGSLHERAWVTQYFNNHDQPRSVSRFGETTRWRVESAKLFATLTHLTPGTPFVYQGEEIGMTNSDFSIDEHRDVFLIHGYHERLARGLSPEVALAELQPWSRDHARTPMQWSDDQHAGFSSAEPWIKVNPNYLTVNVEADLRRDDSVFRYYQRLIKLRKAHRVMVYGEYLDHDYPSEALYVFERRLEETRWLIIANTSCESISYQPHLDPSSFIDLADLESIKSKGAVHTILRTHEVPHDQLADFRLFEPFDMKPFEAMILQITG